ncbi:MAG: lipopolysaccharide biosynthesis protein, partial [Bacteroidales bacterium]
YPTIMTNINFQKELIYSNYHFTGVVQPITLYDYYTNEKYQKFSLICTIKKYTIGLPKVIMKAIRGKSLDTIKSESSLIKSLTEDERDVLKIVNENLSLDVNEKDGYVSITLNMPEPLLAAELAQRVQELLQKYITEFKVEKVAQNLEFVERNYEEGKRNFESKQAELARYRDANKSFTSAVAKTQEEKLMSEYTLLLGIYTELAKQKEQAKIAVTETSPILTVIEPVFVPIEKSKPSRIVMIIVFSFLGLIFGAGLVLLVPYLEENFIPNINKYRFIPKIV